MIGFLAFLAYTYLISIVHTTAGVPWIYGLAAIIIGSITPDILEPATSRNHRGLCHSKGALTMMAFLFGVTALSSGVILFFSHFPVLYPASYFFLGYVFHLLADSLTPAGLPH
jgi:membrane-bound metal-dependent hydrolase YbcI (DUF457 family)